jgi:flagellar biosynthetic protein FliP
MELRNLWLKSIGSLFWLFLPGILFAQEAIPIPKINIGVDAAKTPQEVSMSLQILALLTVLSLAPTLLILTTAFTRIVIILSFIRTAIGTANIPPNQVIVGLSLFLTFYVMGPTYNQLNEKALKPYLKKEIPLEQAYRNAESPIKNFMMKNTYEKDLSFFLNLRHEKPRTKDEVSILSLIPAFILSELKTAFVVGFYIFVPFLIIDLVVASVLMSVGMMMLPPTVVSLPAKLLVFTLADGWTLLVSSIMAGFR